MYYYLPSSGEFEKKEKSESWAWPTIKVLGGGEKEKKEKGADCCIKKKRRRKKKKGKKNLFP